MMYVGSLFSGIGGIELGFERAGFKTLWFVEIDPYAQAVLRKHWPDAVVYGDITSVDWRTVPAVDILTGGFPCQDISSAGKGAGLQGSRSGLWGHYAKAIRVLRPRFAFIENVSILTCRGLHTVLGDLAKVGYDAEWHCVPASSVGAPHRRDRIYIISYPNSSRHIHREPEEFPTEGRESPFSESFAGCEDVSNLSKQRERRLSIQQWRSSKASPDVVRSSTNVPDTKSAGALPIQQRGQLHCTKQICEISSDTICNRWKEGRDRETAFESSERGRWFLEPAVGRVAHGVPRRVDRIRCLGNAVVPQVAEVFAQAIKECLQQEKEV